MNNTNTEEQLNSLYNGIAESVFEMSDEAVEKEFGTKNAEEIRQVLLDAVEINRRKQIYDVLNTAYDLTVEYARKQNMNRDDFKRCFSGIADDYKMAKLRYAVAVDSTEGA